jgi:DNA-binding HxlR family transcriptional regulator
MKPCRTDRRRSACPISFSLDLFGDKWTLLAVRDLMFFGKRRYGELLKSTESVATNILAERLARLEAAGIVKRSPDPERRGGHLYTLTDKGLDLIPVMLELIAWGATYDPKTGAPKSYVRRIKTERDALIREIRRQHTKK